MKTLAPKPNRFLNFPIVTDCDTLVAQAVIFGCPFGKPYNTNAFPNNQAEAPTALRTATNGGDGIRTKGAVYLVLT